MAYCNEYTELISAALDGALSPGQRKELDAHLAACPECAALYKELSALHAALEDLPPVEPPADLKARIMEAVAAEKVVPFPPKRNDRLPHRWRWLASAAVLAIVLLGTWSWKPWEMTAQTRQSAPAAGTGVSTQQDAPAEKEKAAVLSESPVPSREPDEEIMPLSGDSTALSSTNALLPSPGPPQNPANNPAPPTGGPPPPLSRRSCPGPGLRSGTGHRRPCRIRNNTDGGSLPQSSDSKDPSGGAGECSHPLSGDGGSFRRSPPSFLFLAFSLPGVHGRKSAHPDSYTPDHQPSPAHG